MLRGNTSSSGKNIKNNQGRYINISSTTRNYYPIYNIKLVYNILTYYI
jgi:hypothetical protein